MKLPGKGSEDQNPLRRSPVRNELFTHKLAKFEEKSQAPRKGRPVIRINGSLTPLYLMPRESALTETGHGKMMASTCPSPQWPH